MIQKFIISTECYLLLSVKPSMPTCNASKLPIQSDSIFVLENLMLAHEENQFSGRVYSLLKGLLQSSCVSHSRGQIMTISSFLFFLQSVKA